MWTTVYGISIIIIFSSVLWEPYDAKVVARRDSVSSAQLQYGNLKLQEVWEIDQTYHSHNSKK